MNEYQLFDIVYILSTKDVSWLSAPKGHPCSPHGYWNIVAIRGDGKFVLSKDGTVIVTSMNNIKKVANYDLEQVFDRIKRAGLEKKVNKDENDGKEKRK